MDCLGGFRAAQLTFTGAVLVHEYDRERFISNTSGSAVFSATSDECVFIPFLSDQTPPQWPASVFRQILSLRRLVRRALKISAPRSATTHSNPVRRMLPDFVAPVGD